MGRPVLTPDDRLAISQGRGYIVKTTLDRRKQLKETEQSSLAGATEEKHEDVEKVWQEFLTLKGLDINSSLQPDTAMFKDFVEYYASSRNGVIDELPTVHIYLWVPTAAIQSEHKEMGQILTVGLELVLLLNQAPIEERTRRLHISLHVVLKSENRLMYNGLMFFFSMAIADNAIKGFATLDALMKAHVPEGKDSWELQWNKEALELPILRMATAKGVDKIKALTYAALWNQVVSLGHDVGYRDALKIHAIRAGVANKIKDPEVRRQILDHEGTGIYNKAYESKIVKGYGFSMYKGEDAPTDNIEMLQSMDHRRDGNAPKDLPAKEKAEFLQRPDVQHLNMLIAQATTDIDNKPAEHLARCKERQKLYTKKGNLLKSAKNSFRENWFSTSYEEEALRQVQPLEDEDKIIRTKAQQIRNFQLTRRFMPARDRIAKAILAETDECQAALQDIYSLCVDDGRVAYRPNEHPVSGMCPSEGCYTDMNNLVHTLAGFATANCHSRNIATHAASGVVAKMSGIAIVHLILKN
ncbi:hypothetical protein V501_03684 [Pseudogymnoascus sp. VKM F-4519 (FW-2642)]|nr:hypothetical protein V501_03684 [Pseudogymnoascus sp. VKM F-4519 (FW-2642)]